MNPVESAKDGGKDGMVGIGDVFASNNRRPVANCDVRVPTIRRGDGL